jgi:hypothetical protein
MSSTCVVIKSIFNSCLIPNVARTTSISFLISIVAKIMFYISFVVAFIYISFLIPLVVGVTFTFSEFNDSKD